MIIDWILANLLVLFLLSRTINQILVSHYHDARKNCFFRFLWRQFYWCKWTLVFTILPEQLPCKCRMHLHHLSAHWRYHRAEFSQHWYRSEKLRFWQLFWLSRDQWWLIRWCTSPWQTLWRPDPCSNTPCSHTVQPESTVAEVSKTFW